MRVVVNGDDFGYTKANTLGILQAYRDGILRSTTALMNAPYIGWARDLVLEGYEDLGIGVHLSLTLGKPLTDGETLADRSGFFPSRMEALARARMGLYDLSEVHAEWIAQVERFIEVFGKMPTHLDSHHGVHDMTEELLGVAREVAGKYGLDLRRDNDRFMFEPGFSGSKERVEVDNLIKLFEKHLALGHDIELLCHPGYCDLELYRRSSYSLNRVRELDVLCDDRVISFIRNHNIELVHY